MPDCQINWYEENVRIALAGAQEDLLDMAAFQVEGEAKVGATVDTGFMRNAIYAISARRNNRGQAQASGSYFSKKENRRVARELAPARMIDTGKEAAVHAAAEYTIFQEMKHSFIWQAVEKVAKHFGGTIQAVGKERFG